MGNDFVKPENKLTANYYRTRMQKELVLQRLKEKGCRITKQRKILLDIILQEECASCKEIYYKAVSTDSTIGVATVYRMGRTAGKSEGGYLPDLIQTEAYGL